mmetsp:Transcript_19647/g.36348  ORF Transcript_19647/g.36348 Transcript_19647/m.36348 type:complete len:513 (-) Transcript_19647:236-1774(-)
MTYYVPRFGSTSVNSVAQQSITGQPSTSGNVHYVVLNNGAQHQYGQQHQQQHRTLQHGQTFQQVYVVQQPQVPQQANTLQLNYGHTVPNTPGRTGPEMYVQPQLLQEHQVAQRTNTLPQPQLQQQLQIQERINVGGSVSGPLPSCWQVQLPGQSQVRGGVQNLGVQLQAASQNSLPLSSAVQQQAPPNLVHLPSHMNQAQNTQNAQFVPYPNLHHHHQQQQQQHYQPATISPSSQEISARISLQPQAQSQPQPHLEPRLALESTDLSSSAAGWLHNMLSSSKQTEQSVDEKKVPSSTCSKRTRKILTENNEAKDSVIPDDGTQVKSISHTKKRKSRRSSAVRKQPDLSDIIPGELKKRQKIKQYRPSSSIYRGVCWHKRDKCWMARTWIKGKTRCLGSYSCERTAALAVDNVLKLAYGDSLDRSLLNCPSEDEEESSELSSQNSNEAHEQESKGTRNMEQFNQDSESLGKISSEQDTGSEDEEEDDEEEDDNDSETEDQEGDNVSTITKPSG